MDIIAAARARRIQLLEGVAKIDAFLALADELSLEGGASEPAVAPKAKTERAAPAKGLVADTAAAVKLFMEVNGEGFKTRDLVPAVIDSGVTLGGNNDVATLSARLSASKQFELRGGQWYIRAVPGEETADNPTKEPSAASLFQTEGGSQRPPP